ILDGENKASKAAPAEDVADLTGFRVYRRCNLFGDQATRVPGEITQQRRRKQREQKKVNQRQPERGGSDQLTECRHGSYIPRREWYGAAAARIPCRFWSAAAKYAHR